MRLSGKTAIVTGGSSGIGRAIAILFAKEGANVVIGDVLTDPREGGEPTDQVIADAGGTCRAYRCDVSRWDNVDELVTRSVAEFGKLDVMVNNAAIVAGKKILETTEEDWDRVMATNAKGVFFGCKRAIQQMLTQEVVGDARGRIVNITSQHGMVSAPAKFAYGVGKASAVYMTRQIAVDYAENNIICNAVAPGRILTGKPMNDGGNDPIEYSHMRTPMSRLGRPDDVAQAALFLASDEATYITGHNLMVDGGWMAY
jgi:NAD(P)-dependent dehydrogenase (short-subunit alcohol dehydrogenase family)